VKPLLKYILLLLLASSQLFANAELKNNLKQQLSKAQQIIAEQERLINNAKTIIKQQQNKIIDFKVELIIEKTFNKNKLLRKKPVIVATPKVITPTIKNIALKKSQQKILIPEVITPVIKNITVTKPKKITPTIKIIKKILDKKITATINNNSIIPKKITPTKNNLPKPITPTIKKGTIIDVKIDINQQEMKIFSDNKLLYKWIVSTGKEGHDTPTGTFTIKFIEEKHYSSLYNSSYMPYSIFFYGNYAIHGIKKKYTKWLGQNVSHGCVRLHPKDAKILFSLAKRDPQYMRISLNGIAQQPFNKFSVSKLNIPFISVN
jgi:lipoprotein-anchoring transpeptidase ErfK/SrfK